MLNVENWRPVPEFAGYEVSDLGRVRSVKTGAVLKPYIMKNGYHTVGLYSPKPPGKHTMLVHRAVALAWVEGDNSLTVNHEDGDKSNNAASNLSWMTQAANLAHARATGLSVYNKPTQGLRLPARSKSGIESQYLGVCWDNTRKMWMATVVYDGKKLLQKRFCTEDEAAKARDDVVKLHELPLELNFN